MIQQLVDYVEKHTVPIREDASGRIDRGVDVFFFTVKVVGDPVADDLSKLIRNAKQGEFCDLDLLDINEHSFLEIGGWIGSQELALRLMGLGKHLDLWNVITPKILFKWLSEEMQTQMAGLGFVSTTPTTWRLAC